MVHANKVTQLLFTFKEANLKLSLYFIRPLLAYYSLLSYLSSAQTIAALSLVISRVTRPRVTRPSTRTLTKGQYH